jgi:hypothetical protein
MEIQRIRISGDIKQALEKFMGESLPDEISWSELMPVVEKIELTGCEVHINDKRCYITTGEFHRFEVHQDIETDSKIEAVFLAVSDFVTHKGGK